MSGDDVTLTILGRPVVFTPGVRISACRRGIPKPGPCPDPVGRLLRPHAVAAPKRRPETGQAAAWLPRDDVSKINEQMRPGGHYTMPQSGALRSYSTGGYKRDNGTLRTGGTSEPVKTIRGAMRPLPRPLKVQRAVNMQAFDPNATAFTFPTLEQWRGFIGRTFEEPGFMSTTTDENYFRSGTVAGHNVGRDRTMVTLELDVPAGTPAAFLGAPGGPGIFSESELLLDAGTRFTIDEVWEDDGYIHARGRVLSR